MSETSAAVRLHSFISLSFSAHWDFCKAGDKRGIKLVLTQYAAFSKVFFGRKQYYCK
jgi:hypothetical protein